MNTDEFYERVATLLSQRGKDVDRETAQFLCAAVITTLAENGYSVVPLQRLGYADPCEYGPLGVRPCIYPEQLLAVYPAVYVAPSNDRTPMAMELQELVQPCIVIDPALIIRPSLLDEVKAELKRPLVP